LKEVVGADWRLRFDQAQKTFRLSEIRQDEILDYNLDLLSDSMKRFFFYAAILQTSHESALVFDEPDVYAFPPYPKKLGEMIAADETNQFFLTTHNPYLLTALAEKTPSDQLAVFVAFRDEEHGATAATRLSSRQVSELVELGAAIFFNLSDFVPS
jgi:predicted ATPase